MVHYGHVVDAESLVGSTEDTLLRVSGKIDPTSLLAGAILDVPLRGNSENCNEWVSIC